MIMNEDLNKIVYKYILNSGHGKCAAIFLKRSKLTNDNNDDTPLSKEVLTTITDLNQIYETYRSNSKPSINESTKTSNSKRNNLPTTPAAAGVKTTEKPIVTKKAAAKDSSSSSDDSSSDDSSSDEEIAHTKTPVKSTSVTKPTLQPSAGKIPVAAKASIAEISSSSSETESSDSDDEEVVPKPTPKSTPVIKKNVEVKVIVEKTKPSKVELKPLSTTTSSSSKKPVLTKPSSSSSSDSDDDSSDDSSVEKTVVIKPVTSKAAVKQLPIEKTKVASKSAPEPSIVVKASAKLPTTVEKKAVIGKNLSAVQSNSSSDDSGSSDSDDSSSSDESVPPKAPIVPSLKSTPAKKSTAVESSSEEDSESDSSSDESVDVAAVVNDKKRKLNNAAAAQRPAKEDNTKAKIQKVESSSSDSESDSESSSDSDDSSDDSSDESESDEAIQERVQMKNELNKKKMEDSKRASEEWMKVTHHHYPYYISVSHSSPSS